MVTASCKWILALSLPAFFLCSGFKTGNIPINRDERIHPFHVSVTEINHNASEKTLEIGCKVFTDDFEKALSGKFNSKVDLGNPKDKPAMDKMVAQYIHEHLRLKCDSKEVVLNYIGYDTENEAVFVFLQGNEIPIVKRIDATNTILHDLFNDQVEIMHVSVAGNRKSIKIDYPESQAVFTF